MIRKAAIFVFVMLISALASGQYYYGGLSGSLHLPSTQFTVDSSGNMRFVPGDMGFSLEAGGGFASFGKAGMYSVYTSPSVAYNISDRFRIRGGVTLYNNFGDLYPGYGETPAAHHSMTGTRVFVSGDYLLSNKLMLSGSAYKDFTPLNPAFVNDPRMNGGGSEGMIFNIRYSPARNLHINATIEYHNVPGYYRPTPFYNPSPFRPNYGW